MKLNSPDDGALVRRPERAGSLPPHDAGQQGVGVLKRLRTLGPVVALISVMVVFGVMNHHFLSPDNLRAIADTAAVPAIVAVGATFVILLGRIDLSVEGVMGATSITVALLVANSRTGLSLGLIGVFGALAVGAAFGALNALLHVGIKIPSFLATLGTWFIGLGVGTVLFNGKTPQITDPGLTKLAQGSILTIPNGAILALFCVILGGVALRYTRFGRRVYAIGGEERLALLNGLHTRGIKIGCFVIAGTCSALAGVLTTLQVGEGSATAGTGSGALFSGITAVVIGGTSLTGGRGGVWNSFVGALLISAIADGLILIDVSPNVQDIVRGLIIVIGVAAVGWSSRSRIKVAK
jgi:ribose transport system permease protein